MRNVLLAVILGLIASGCGAFGDGEPEPTPTQTPMPATSTPPKQAFSGVECQYVSEVTDLADQLTDDLEDLLDLIALGIVGQLADPEEADEGGEIFLENWRTQVKLAVELIQLDHVELVVLFPPPSLQEVHGVYVDAFSNLADDAISVEQALDSRNADGLVAGSASLEDSAKELLDATELLSEFRTTRSGTC